MPQYLLPARCDDPVTTAAGWERVIWSSFRPQVAFSQTASIASPRLDQSRAVAADNPALCGIVPHPPFPKTLREFQPKFTLRRPASCPARVHDSVVVLGTRNPCGPSRRQAVVLPQIFLFRLQAVHDHAPCDCVANPFRNQTEKADTVFIELMRFAWRVNGDDHRCSA
jgi:hypothetical protein